MNMAVSKLNGKGVYDEQVNNSPRNYLFGIVTLILVCSLLFWTYGQLMLPSTFPIKNVRVEGEFINLKPDALQSIVSESVRGGFFNVNVDVIQKVLLKEPWVDQVLVMRIWPDTINVIVTENVAVARWKDTGLLNSNGSYFSPSMNNINHALPVLSGPENTYQLLLDRYTFLQKEIDGLDIRITFLNLNERQSWEIVTDKNLKLLLGRDSFESRISNFVKHAYPKLNNDFKNIKSIDMRYTNGFSVEWKEPGEKT